MHDSTTTSRHKISIKIRASQAFLTLSNFIENLQYFISLNEIVIKLYLMSYQTVLIMHPKY
jgi:hypothetical protein